MNITTINQAAKYEGETITLQGWLANKRSSGKIAFLQLRDGTGQIQVVAVKTNLDDLSWQALESLYLESSLSVDGLVKADSRSSSGFELEASKITVIQAAPDDFPIGKKAHGPAFLLDNRHFWLRTPKQIAIQKIRSHIIKSMFDFYIDHEFINLTTPIFTPTACEGTTDLFEVNYFDDKAYLSQSGQLYLESVLPGFRRVFDFQPVFRAEKSKTRRHLTEFWMSNAEAAFIDHDENLNLQQQLIQSVISSVLTSCQNELAVLDRDTKSLEQALKPFARVSHLEAVKLLQQKGSLIGQRDDLGAEDETLLSEIFGQPVFVEYYPAEVKAFYMKRLESDESRAKCADLIAPEGHGEVIGGSQREDDYDRLLQSINQHHLPVQEFSWYLDMRRYGSVVHSGFGVGLERLVKWICNLHHVRETIPYPRMLNRLRP